MNTGLSPLRVGGPRRAPVLNIAHRGARAFAPENSLPAFEKAVTFGCHMIELDVHVSKDGALIIHHDDQLTRCTDVEARFPGRDTYFVSDFSAEELATLDAGSWYVQEISLPSAERQFFLQTLSEEELECSVSADERTWYRSGDVRLPTLGQALEVAQRTGMMVNIEMKTMPRMYPGLTKEVVDLVTSLGLERRVIVSSFDHQQLVEVRRITDVIATGALTSDRLAKPGEYLQLLDSDAYNPGCYGDYDSLGFGSVTGKLDPVGIVSARTAGCGVNVWTCNDPAQMRALIGAGVTGLITDFPNRVRDVLREGSSA